MVLHKVNRRGEFTPFPGVTVIAKVREEDRDFWSTVNEALKSDPLITQYYAVLPDTSYHMTTNNLHTQRGKTSEEWESFIRTEKNMFEALQTRLDQKHFTPELKFKGWHANGAIQLIVEIPKKQMEIIKAVAKEFKIERKMPRFFHITLAYQYTRMDSTTIKKMEKRIREIFDTHLASTSQWTLQAPHLCFFNDMTAYHEWDGHGFPFEPVPSEPSSTAFSTISSFFSSSEASSGKSDEISTETDYSNCCACSVQ